MIFHLVGQVVFSFYKRYAGGTSLEVERAIKWDLQNRTSKYLIDMNITSDVTMVCIAPIGNRKKNIVAYLTTQN